METTQRDRDSLREAQQRLHSQYAFIVGNLVEHKIQNPATYKTLSRQEQGLTKDARPDLPKIQYKSKYLSMDVDDMPKKDPEPIKDAGTKSCGLPLSLDEVQANLWLNMDRFEFDKLEWMSEKAEKEYQEKLKSTTHFDSQGKAVQPQEQSGDQQQGVHDIGSLVKLLDSTFQPQITYALNVVSKIATRATIGLYDAVFDDNIHEILIKECLLRVRHHIDSPNETVCQAALKCLRAMICNTQVDEIFMDKLHHLKSEEADLTMWLMTDVEEFGPDMKDNECIAQDAILALLTRTDLFKRFLYLLSRKSTPEFQSTYFDCIIDILIRFARYSRGMAWILNADFPKIIISLFQPADIVRKDKLDQSLALRSLKFLRILAQASNEFKLIDCQPNRKELKLPDTLVATINAYYQIDYSRCGQEDENYESDILLHKIHNETLRLMKSLSAMKAFSSHVFSTINLDHATLVERVKTLSLLSALQDIRSPSSLNWQYAAALIDLLGSMMEHERYQTGGEFFKTIWITYIRPLTMQWITEILRERIIPHQDVSMTLAVAVQQFARCKDEKSIHDLYNLILDKHSIPNDPNANSSLSYFKHLVREATTRSQLGSFLKTNGRLRDPVMLPSYGCMNFNRSEKYEYQLGSMISLHTPYILLDVYFRTLQNAGNRFGQLLKHYVNNADLVRYLRGTSCYYKYPVNYEKSVQKSTLAQQEIRLLSNGCLFMSHYCLSRTNLFGEPRPQDELREIESSLAESYSQLLSDAVSVIGLINPEVGQMEAIREKLLEKIVLNEMLHNCLIRQSRIKKTLDTSFQNLQIYSMNRTNEPNRNDNLGIARGPADSSCLKSIYLNSEQTGRFWVLQPFIDYRLETVNNSKATQDNRWFARNVAHNMLGRPLSADCTDIDVIGRLLEFNSMLTYQSPSYFQLAVKPNIEEHLCLLGSIFLHDNLFLDPNISRHLALNLEILLRVGLSQGIDRVFSDASLKLVTLGMTLMDFFNQLVDQYEAASYCDVVFTNFLLLFITTKCDKAFRRTLFSDKLETCLSQISIGHGQVWIPIEYLTREKESDHELKTLIKRSAAYTVRSSYLDYYRRYHTS